MAFPDTSIPDTPSLCRSLPTLIDELVAYYPPKLPPFPPSRAVE
jgi:hypothetical protein